MGKYYYDHIILIKVWISDSILGGSVVTSYWLFYVKGSKHIDIPVLLALMSSHHYLSSFTDVKILNQANFYPLGHFSHLSQFFSGWTKYFLCIFLILIRHDQHIRLLWKSLFSVSSELCWIFLFQFPVHFGTSYVGHIFVQESALNWTTCSRSCFDGRVSALAVFSAQVCWLPIVTGLTFWRSRPGSILWPAQLVRTLGWASFFSLPPSMLNSSC